MKPMFVTRLLRTGRAARHLLPAGFAGRANGTKTVLFVRPDYHASFFMRDSLEDLGWTVDIFVPADWPEGLLYSTDRIIRRDVSWRASKLSGLLFILSLAMKYSVFVYYGRPPAFEHISVAVARKRGIAFSAELAIFRLLRRKVIFLPTGCHDMLTKEAFSKLDGGNVCGNCGAWNRCDDSWNLESFRLVKKYFSWGISDGTVALPEYKSRVVRWKSIDLSLWAPGIAVPSDFRLPDSGTVKILHSNYLDKSNRNWLGRNIKGSPYVVSAVRRLKSEGHDVELISPSDLHIKDVRFLQAQADIVVEQLIYGWWGSTGVETMALGKPVVCYLRREWKENFLKNFPEFESLPIVEANTATVYEALRQLVINEDLRTSKGRESRVFAERHFSPHINAKELSETLHRDLGR